MEHERFHQQLRSKIERAGLTDRFVWLGEVDYDRMPEFHSAMSLCVAPARYEGFGLVPLEAMASAVPVVATQTGCYREVIIPGVSGSLVPCDDVESLTSALDKLLAAPEQLPVMGRAGRTRIEQSYSASLEAVRIVDVYRELWSKAA